MIRPDGYKLVFLGPDYETIIDVTHKLATHVTARLSISIESATKLIASNPVVFARGISLAQALRIKAILEDMGARVRIEPMDSCPPMNRLVTSATQPPTVREKKAAPEKDSGKSLSLVKADSPWEIVRNLHEPI